MAREAAHVHLVDDQVLDRDLERAVALPVEVVEDEPAAVRAGAVPVGLRAPDVAAADRRGRRGRAGPWTCRSGGRRAGSKGRPCGSRIRCSRSRGRRRSWRRHCRCGSRSGKGISAIGCGCALLEQHQGAGGGVAGVNGEVDAAGHERGAERKRPPRAELVARRIRASDRRRCALLHGESMSLSRRQPSDAGLRLSPMGEEIAESR